VKSGLSVGSGLLFATGLFVGVVLRNVLLGVLLFALGAILFAIRGYLNTGDKAVAWRQGQELHEAGCLLEPPSIPFYGARPYGNPKATEQPEP
jgi:hypothetical protein